MHIKPRFHRRNILRCFCKVSLFVATMGLATCGFIRALEAQEEAGRFRDAQTGFSFLPPSGWERSDNLPHPELRFLYLGPIHQGFRANVNMNGGADSGESFELTSKQVKEGYPKMFPAWKFIEEGEIEIDGKATYVLSGSYRGGPHTVRMTQFFIRGNGKLCVVTFTTASDAFERLKHSIVRSASSIKLE